MSWNVAILWKLCLCLISFYQFSINVIDANTVDFQSNDHGFNDSYKMLRGDPDRWIPSGYCENLQWKYSFRVDSDGPRQRGSYVFFALEPNTQYQVMLMMMMMVMMMMMMMIMRMRAAGSVGQLGREFWSQQWHWSSGFVHRIHSQCHHSNHDHHYFFHDLVDNVDNEKFDLMLSTAFKPLMRQEYYQ